MFWNVTLSLLNGMGEAVKLFGFTLLIAIPLGLLIALGTMCKFKLLKGFLEVLIWIIRGTPLMLQLIIIFYGPGFIGWNIFGGTEYDRMLASIIAFAINYACYFAVIYKGGIEGVPRGQIEAGQVLGLTKTQIFFKITLLQMVKRIVPPMSNEIITLVKDTSLARIIAVTELIKAGEKFMKSDGLVWPLFYTMVFYLVFIGVLTLLFKWIEKKLSYFN